MTAPVAPMEARHSVTPLEALYRLIGVASIIDTNECKDELIYNVLQRELAVAKEVAKSLAAPVAPQPNKNALADEVIAALDALQVGCTEQSWIGWQNCDGEEVGTRLEAAITAYRASQPSDKAASFWSEVEARNHEVRPAQQVEAVGKVPVAYMQRRIKVWMAPGSNYRETDWEPVTKEDAETNMENIRLGRHQVGEFEFRPLYATPQLEAQQAGDVALLPAKMTPEMREAMWEGITRHGLSNLEYWIEDLYNDIRAAAVAQGRKA